MAPKIPNFDNPNRIKSFNESCFGRKKYKTCYKGNKSILSMAKTVMRKKARKDYLCKLTYNLIIL